MMDFRSKLGRSHSDLTAVTAVTDDLLRRHGRTYLPTLAPSLPARPTDLPTYICYMPHLSYVG